MEFKNFSHNGKILPIEQAQISLFCIEYQYGFGVYETIRILNGIPYFLDEHINRLTESAKIIELDHSFSSSFIEKSILDLVKNSNLKTYNLKILLIGNTTKENAQLFILCFNPLFPDKKLYKEGATFITFNYERVYPHAKTLNMLQNYIAYKKAKEVESYDALLINHEGNIIEGTRTNFFCIKHKTIFSPNEKDILLGITRKAMLKMAIQNGFEVVQKEISQNDLNLYEGAFVTSTSSKIMPIKSINGNIIYEKPSKTLKELMKLFDCFLTECDGVLK